MSIRGDGFRAYGSREQQYDTIPFLSNGRRRRLNRRRRREQRGPGLLVGAVVGLVMLGGSLYNKAIDKHTGEGPATHTETTYSAQLHRESHDFEESPPPYSERPEKS